MSTPSSGTHDDSEISKKRKHESEDEYGNSTRKEQKRSKLDTDEGLLKYTRLVKPALDGLKELKEVIIKASLPEDPTISTLSARLGLICLENHQPDLSTLELLKAPLEPFDDEVLSKLPDAMRRKYLVILMDTNLSIELVVHRYELLAYAHVFPPSPSVFAEASVWPEWQSRPNCIYNMRPTRNIGIPITTLHPVFARFRATLKRSQPPAGFDTSVAHNVAFCLCTEMGDSFESKASRRDKFEEQLRLLLWGYYFENDALLESKAESCTLKADLLVYKGRRAVLGGVYKLETGDAYMEMSRIYQAWVNQQKEKDANVLDHGAPLILISLTGPLLMVVGGFWDGKHAVVEPLAEPCLMLPDYDKDRPQQLIRILLAIKEAAQSLASLDYSAKVSFTPDTPRVYPSFTTFDGKTHDLTFKSRLTRLSLEPPRDLIFLATSPAYSKQILVKLVAGDQYGVEAHRKLAKAGYAPKLYGVATVEGACRAYVMEYLPYSKGWYGLYQSRRFKKGAKAWFKAPLEKLLDAMKENNVVHGDLRENNIMIREFEDEEPDLRVIDFDWAGESGQVNYPVGRNENIPWPAKPGEPILTEHDRALLMACLDPHSWH